MLGLLSLTITIVNLQGADYRQNDEYGTLIALLSSISYKRDHEQIPNSLHLSAYLGEVPPGSTPRKFEPINSVFELYYSVLEESGWTSPEKIAFEEYADSAIFGMNITNDGKKIYDKEFVTCSCST
jgi:hypothetical protein